MKDSKLYKSGEWHNLDIQLSNDTHATSVADLQLQSKIYPIYLCSTGTNNTQTNSLRIYHSNMPKNEFDTIYRLFINKYGNANINYNGSIKNNGKDFVTNFIYLWDLENTTIKLEYFRSELEGKVTDISSVEYGGDKAKNNDIKNFALSCKGHYYKTFEKQSNAISFDIIVDEYKKVVLKLDRDVYSSEVVINDLEVKFSRNDFTYKINRMNGNFKVSGKDMIDIFTGYCEQTDFNKKMF